VITEWLPFVTAIADFRELVNKPPALFVIVLSPSTLIPLTFPEIVPALSMETGTDEKLLIPQLYWPVPWIVAPAWFVIDPPLARKMPAPEVKRSGTPGTDKNRPSSEGAADESSRVPFPELTPAPLRRLRVPDRGQAPERNKPKWREDEADRDPKGQQDLSLG